MSDCIFCKIANGEIPCTKLWEDDEHLAFLDIFPNTKGMTLVIPKKHYDSDVFTMDDKPMNNLFNASKKVVEILKKGLGLYRISIVMEGMGINHAHIKLYPLHGIGPDREENRAKDTIYFDKYEGYISTQLGPKADPQELQKLADQIILNNK